MMILLFYILYSLFVIVFGISNQRLCADPKCEQPISYAVAELQYLASEKGKISFKKDDKITIYSKGAGNDTSLWGAEVGGRRGYIPFKMVKETKVLHKFSTLKYIVPTDEAGLYEPNVPDSVPEESASRVPFISDTFSVVDGTTIYANSTENVLETQPIDTVAFNVQPSVDIQSSKTIDATRISENMLDEPNNSIIIPQPTTSAPVYSEVNENVGTETRDFMENIEKSSSGSTKPENESERAVSNENNDGKYVENDQKANDVPNKENDNGRQTQDGQHEEVEDKGDAGDKSDEDGGDEVEDEDEEEMEEYVEKNENPSEVMRDKMEELSEIKSEETNYSEQNIPDNNVIKPIVEEVHPIDVVQEKEHDVDSVLPKSEDEPITGNSESDKANSTVFPEINGGSQEDGFKDIISDTNQKENTNQVPEIMKESAYEGEHNELTHNVGFNNENVLSATSNKNEAWSENKINLSTDSDEKSHAIEDSDSSVVSEDSNAENLQEKNEIEDKEPSFNPFGIFRKYNDIIKSEDNIDREINEKDDLAVSYENSGLQDMSVVTTNGVAHEVPNADSYPPVTEEYKIESSLDIEAEGTENQQSPSPAYDGEPISQGSDTQDSEENVQMKAQETQVQSTCEMDGVGCEPKSGDLLAQESSEKTEQEWFTSLFESAHALPEIFVSSSSKKDMYKNNIDIFQTTQSFLIVTAITVLVFTLGYYYLEKQRRDGFLIAKINSLEKELLVSSQEKYTLKDELEITKEKLSAFITSVDSEETSSLLKDELEECRAVRVELEEQVANLEKELEAATEAGLELNKMMSELLSAQHGSDTLMKSVEHLQRQLDSQQSTISTMTASLKAKNIENENLQSELNASSERVKYLEDELVVVKEALTNLQKEKSEIEHDFLVKNQSIEHQLVEALESKSADSQRLCRELDALQDVLDETRKTLAAREGEVSVLRECLNHSECMSNGGESSISLEELLNVGHLRAKIDNITKERDELLEKLQGEEDARKLLEDHMKIVSEEVSTLRTKYEEADREKLEAQTRLEVLSNYFKEKETQLQKELGLQEAMYIQKEGDALSTIEQIKAFQEEIENYKAQNEILKKEILDQERSMKSQIAILEKKAHENWVAARQAERRLEESKQETSQLRNVLTMTARRVVGTIPGPDLVKPPERGTLELEHNGEMSSSPAHKGESQEMPSSPLHFGLPGSPPLLPPSGQPLPPGPFPSMPFFLPPGAPGMPFPMPPPPASLFPNDLRPPPLGRMSSPPPEPRGSFSPFEHSPPISPFEHSPFSPHYRSPLHYEDSPSRYRHHTPPASGTPPFSGPFPPGKWDERSDPPRSSFRPLHRDPPREPKGSTLSSGHSSESLDKGSRHSRV